MDATDVRILQQLVWKPFDARDVARGILGPWDIARELGVHGNTVKRRLEQMQAAGVVQGIHMVLAPGILGMESAVYAFRWADPAAKAEGVRLILEDQAGLSRPGSLDSWTFVGDEAWIGVFGAPGRPMEEKVREYQHVTGAIDVRLVERRAWDVDVAQISDLDVRIMEQLTRDALRPVTAVAEAVRVTPKTVRARLRRLAELGAFMIVPYSSVGRIDGLVPFVIQVDLAVPEDPAARVSFFNAFPDAFFRSAPAAARPFVLLAADTTAAIGASLERAQQLPGVELARALLLQDSTPCPSPADITPVPLLMATAPHRASFP